MTICAAAVNGLPLMDDCGNYRECDDCDGSPRSIPVTDPVFAVNWQECIFQFELWSQIIDKMQNANSGQYFSLKGSLRGGK